MVLQILFGVLVFVMALGIPIAWCLGIAGLAGLMAMGSVPLSIVPQKMFSGVDIFPMLCLPFFILAWEFMGHGSIGDRLLRFAMVCDGRVRGELSLANVLNSMFFGGITGTQLGINLDAAGVTANDPPASMDGDAGANNLQNFPVLTSATVVSGTQVTVVGSVNSTANIHFRIEFFASPVADGSAHGEAQRYLGFANVTSGSLGNATFNASLTATVALGEFVTATATSCNSTFSVFANSSESAQNVVATNSAPVLNPGRSPATSFYVYTAGDIGTGYAAGTITGAFLRQAKSISRQDSNSGIIVFRGVPGGRDAPPVGEPVRWP